VVPAVEIGRPAVPFFLFVSGDSFSPQAFPSFILFYFIGWVVGQGILWL